MKVEVSYPQKKKPQPTDIDLSGTIVVRVDAKYLSVGESIMITRVE